MNINRREMDSGNNVKRTLSLVMSVSVEVNSLFEDKNGSITITRIKLEELSQQLFRSTKVFEEKVLREFGSGKGETHDVA